jgi:TolB-like protein/Tfp pilus assembly protein PilF
MASLIPGFEYDIFISYRQKDNKGDKWVSEFVDALKTELESTFKEEISVYFDINPHNGLLETHDVDASLKDKLKCLIFIPVISRTYCDPKSFAWEHEFKAFVKLASQDQFGLKVKLPNGNVASRVLPVRIHDLDNDDIQLCESVLGGVLRSIDFIYRLSGVNRPLRSHEDLPQDNLNKTLYRDQINKIANAIEEIIHSLKKVSATQVEEKIEQQGTLAEDNKDYERKRPKSNATNNQKLKKWLIISLVMILCIVGAFVIFKIVEGSKKANDITKLEKSIAVLPFVNDSPDQENTYFINGIMDEILYNLQKIRNFRVLSRTSTAQYRGTSMPPIPKIAKDLGVNYIVEGSGQRYGNKIRIRVELIAGNNENHLWGESFEQEIKATSDIFRIQSKIAEAIATELKATIVPEEKQLIERKPTASLTAYDYFKRGREEHWNYLLGGENNMLENAKNHYLEALKYDSTFARAYTGMAQVYWDKHYWKTLFSKDFLDSVLILANKALSFDNQLSEAYVFRGQYYLQKRKSDEAIKEFDKALQLNPNDWMAFKGRGDLYHRNNDFVESIKNYNKAISLHPDTELPILLSSLSLVYTLAGFRDQAVHYIKEKIKLDKDSLIFYSSLGFIEETNGNYENALHLYKRCYTLDNGNTDVLWRIGNIYVFLEKYHEALNWFKQFIEHSEHQGSSGYISIIGYNRIGLAYWKSGYKVEAKYYFDKFIDNITKVDEMGRAIQDPFADAYDIAGAYAFLGEKEKAYEKLRIASNSQRENLYGSHYVKNDATFESFRDDPIFQQYVRDVESKYLAEHERVRKWLEEQGML